MEKKFKRQGTYLFSDLTHLHIQGVFKKVNVHPILPTTKTKNDNADEGIPADRPADLLT